MSAITEEQLWALLGKSPGGPTQEVVTPITPTVPAFKPSVPYKAPASNVTEESYDLAQDAIDQAGDAKAYNPFNLHDEFNRRLQANQIPYSGVTKDYSRKKGVNDANAKDTLRYSRMVDALNNRFYTRGARNSGVQISGTGGANVKNQLTPAQVYKMDGLETAESRAQTRKEGYEQRVTNAEIDRAEEAKSMPQKLQWANQMAIQARAGKLSDAQIQMIKDVWEQEVHQKITAPFQLAYDKVFQTFLQELMHINIPVQQLKMYMSTLTGNPDDYIAGTMLGQAFGFANVVDAGTLTLMAKLTRASINFKQDPDAFFNMLQTMTGWLAEQGVSGYETVAKEQK